MKRLRLSSKVRKAFQGSSRGFTLIEVLIALALVGIIAIAFLGGLTTASRAVLTADVRTTAESLARSQMEHVKAQDYIAAPDGGEATYLKLTDIPDNYIICSVNRGRETDNCGAGEPIIAVPWDTASNEAVANDNDLQRIELVVKHGDKVVITLEGYKVER